MKKLSVLLTCLSCAIAMVFTFVCVAEAISLDSEDKYQLGGYVENFTGVRLQDRTFAGGEKAEAGDCETFRNTLFLDFHARFSEELQFKVIGRGWYDNANAFSSNTYQPAMDDTVPGPGASNMKNDFDFREYYLTYSLGNFIVKAGRQQVVWGESDALRMSDIINPLDISWYWSFPSWEEIRIPLHLVNMVYNAPHSKYHLRFEGVWNPLDFRPTQIAPYGAVWDPGLPPNPVFGWIVDQQKHDLPERNLSNGSGGGRVKALFGGWDVSAFGYYQRVQDGVSTFDPANAVNPAFPVKYQWPYALNVGGTFNFESYTLGTVFRGECSYVPNHPFSPTNPVAVDYEERDTFAFMLGFDRNTWLKFLNPDKTFFISGQWFQKFALGGSTHDEFTTGFGDDGLGRTQTVFSLLINTEYVDATIKPEVLAVHSLTEECGFVDYHVAWEPTYTLRFTLGALNIWGNSQNAGIWGPIQKNDQIYFKVRWSF